MTCESVDVEKLHPSYAVNLFAALLSILGSGLILLLFAIGRKREHISKLIGLLSIADFCSSLSIAASQIFLLINQDAYNYTLCVLFRSSIQFFMVSSLIWTSCIAFHLFQELRYLTKIPRPLLHDVIYNLVSWGIPAILCTILIGGHNIIPGEQHWCHLKKDFEISFWFIPLVVAMLWNLCFYLVIIKHVRDMLRPVASSNNRPAASEAIHYQLLLIRKLSFLMLVFVLCWTPDFFNHIRQYFFQSDCPSQPLLILQDLFSPLQGFLNSLVYGFANKEFRMTFAGLFDCIPWFRTHSTLQGERAPLVNETKRPPRREF